MRPSAIHILLSFLLLLTYGVERVLPCTGIWDVDCERGAIEISYTEPGGTDHDHSEHSDSHSDHQCSCPCHTVAITETTKTIELTAEHPSPPGQITLSLLYTTISPPEPVPIG